MTERLAQLLHAEADHLDVPPPDAGSTLSQGRGLRRRRRLVTGAVAVAVVAVIGGGALGINAISGGDDGAKLEPAEPFDSGAVFSIGTTVYLDDAKMEAQIDDKAIKSLHYTSVGVLVRHGNNSWSDGGGPQRFSMVRPDGSVDRLDVTLEETVHSTDPTQPYLAYALKTGDGFDIVVRDLRDDTEVARIAIPAGSTGGGWSAPPVSLSGDIVYVGTGPTPYAVDWRNGTADETDLIEPGMPDVHGGRDVVSREGETAVVDVATGVTLLSTILSEDQYAWYSLSPDGRYAILSLEDMTSPDSSSTTEVYSVDTGEHVSLPRADYGWTGLGDLFTVSKDELTTCSAGTGDCTTVEHGITMPPKTPSQEVCEKVPGGEECYTTGGETWESQLKLGGRTYES